MKNTPIIAVVQDDAIYRITTQRFLQTSNLFSDVLVFDNGLSSLSYIQHHNTVEQLPDIILLDINMPVMDGWTFLAEYEKLTPILSKCSSIYIHTASLFERDLHKAEQYNYIVGYLPQPLRINELKKHLSSSYKFNMQEA